MARKAKLTPRERRTLEILAPEKASKLATFAFEEMMDNASEVQDMLYFKSIDNKSVTNADLRVAYNKYLNSIEAVDEAFRDTTKTTSDKYKVVISKV